MALREWIDYMSISGNTPYLPIGYRQDSFAN